MAPCRAREATTDRYRSRQASKLCSSPCLCLSLGRRGGRKEENGESFFAKSQKRRRERGSVGCQIRDRRAQIGCRLDNKSQTEWNQTEIFGYKCTRSCKPHTIGTKKADSQKFQSSALFQALVGRTKRSRLPLPSS